MTYKFYIRKCKPYPDWKGEWWIYRELWKGAYILPFRGFDTWREAMDFLAPPPSA